MAGEEVAVIPAVDPSAGGGAADGAAPAGGDEEVVLPPGDEGEPGAGAGEGDEALPGEPEDQHSEREDVTQDLRTMDKATKDLINKLTAAGDKVGARILRDTYFANQSVMKEFPEAQNFKEALREIRTHKATLEAIGGTEGIEKLEGEVNDYRKEINQFANGDKELITQLGEANPQSLMVSARNSLEWLGAKDVKLLDEAILPMTVARFESAGLHNMVKGILKACEEGKGQDAWNAANDIDKWIENLKKKAGDISKNVKEVDPRQRELDEREQRISTQEAEHRDRQISNEVTRINNQSMGSVLTKKFWEQVGWSGKEHGENRREFTQNLMERVWKAMKVDKTFQRNAHAMKSKNDNSRTAEFIADKFNELLPDIFRQYRNVKFPSVGGKKPAAAAPGAGKDANGAGGAAKPAGGGAGLSGKPSKEDIDWDKTTDEMFNMGGKVGQAYSKKDGKLHQWDWTKL